MAFWPPKEEEVCVCVRACVRAWVYERDLSSTAFIPSIMMIEYCHCAGMHLVLEATVVVGSILARGSDGGKMILSI